ncbi:MAG: M61 family metallopeptidase [Pyrinomonadaceae bacterium]
MVNKYTNIAFFILVSVCSVFGNLNAGILKTDQRNAVKHQTADSVSAINYVISMPKPATHLLEVEMSFDVKTTVSSVDLKMPVWTPGSYLIREYARHVQDFSSKNANGISLKWQKINKNTWRIETNGRGKVLVSYKVYANELTVRTNELNDGHAFWNNAALLLFPAGQLSSPATVSVNPFGNWKVATGLSAISGKQNTFRSPNFDVLYDSPFEVSDFKETTFNVRNVPHRIVVTGDGNFDLKKIAVDTAKIVEEGAKIFGELPMDNYLFILNLRGGGGLEHLNSTALQFPQFGFKPQASYMRFLSLVAHEYFHLWNVKRIRPDALGPFDYENENYTKLLWVAEGITSYYESLLLHRAGFTTDNGFLNSKASMIRDLQNRQGRFETSLEDASFDAWIKGYRPDENAINNQISYYDKGEIVGMMLDIEIRTKSAGKGTLDDVMRILYNDYYKKGKNFTPADFQTAAEKIAGSSLDDFFSQYVRGKAELDYDKIVSGIGLRLARFEPNKEKAYIGANTAEENGRLMIRTIPAGTPAYEQGLNTGDQIVAIDGNRASQTFLQSYVGEKKPGDKVTITVFRFDRLKEFSITLGADTRVDFQFETLENPTELQRRLYREYLGREL